MAPLTDQNDSTHGHDWSAVSRFPAPLPIGRWADVQISLGWSLPAALAVIIAAGWWLRGRPGNSDLPVLSGILAAAILLGALWQAAVRLTTVRLLGGQPLALTIRAFGSWGPTACLGGWKRMLAGLLPPAGSFALAAWLAAMPPRGEGWAGIALVPLELTGQFDALSVVTAGVWVLFLQSLVQCLPLPGCHGREAIAGCIEAIGKDWDAAVRRRLAKWVVGLFAIGLLAACLWGLSVETPRDGIPRWPFLALLSGACWASRRMEEYSLEETSSQRPQWLMEAEAATGLERSMPPSAAKVAAHGQPVSVWRHPWIRYRQWQATRRLRAAHQRERSEAVDAERLDAILERLHVEGFESLSSDEKAVLRRVSERLRHEEDRPA